jgi:hypothetical protein
VKVLPATISDVAEIGTSIRAIAAAGTPAGSWTHVQAEEQGS